ncbi:MAG: hypothetical protein ACI4OP_03370 [Candidatus Coprovivens sp.]
MIQVLYILLGMVILLFALAILFAVLPDKKEKEEKPINKTPIRIELQIQYEDYLYTLYNDGTWEVDSIY